MDYYRVGYAQSPLVPMGMGSSPDGLGAYFQTTYQQPIRAVHGGTSTVAAYQPIDGLGAYFATTYQQPIRPAQGGASIIADYKPIDGLGELTPAQRSAVAWASLLGFVGWGSGLLARGPVYARKRGPWVPLAGAAAGVAVGYAIGTRRATAPPAPTAGLGACLPCMAAAAGLGADAVPAATPSALSKPWVKVALGVGAVTLAWYTVPAFRKLWGPGGALAKNKRHRRNAHTGGPDDHVYAPSGMRGWDACARCGYARGQHLTAAELKRLRSLTPNRRRRHRKNAKWSGKAKRSLPDTSFLYVAPGGHARIEGGKKVTIPRSLRKFPYRTAAGNIDLPHLRNAIARIPQSNLPESQRTLLQAKARAILAEHGGYKRARKAAGGVLRQAA